MKLLFMSLLFIFVGCKNNSQTNNQQQEELICLCLPQTQVDLKSELEFPDRIKVTLNDLVLVDECSAFSDEAVKVRRFEKHGAIRGKITGRIKGNLKVVIIDRGSDCTNDAIFYAQDDVFKKVTVLNEDRAYPYLEKIEIKL